MSPLTCAVRHTATGQRQAGLQRDGRPPRWTGGDVPATGPAWLRLRRRKAPALFTFLLQLRETLQHGHPLHLFTIFVGTVWILWAGKILLSRRYRPRTAPYRLPASVVIPVVDEPLELFREVLRRIGGQAPDETIVVINGPATPPSRKSATNSPGSSPGPGRQWRASATRSGSA